MTEALSLVTRQEAHATEAAEGLRKLPVVSARFQCIDAAVDRVRNLERVPGEHGVRCSCNHDPRGQAEARRPRRRCTHRNRIRRPSPLSSRVASSGDWLQWRQDRNKLVS
jgi:hypothetical protein